MKNIISRMSPSRLWLQNDPNFIYIDKVVEGTRGQSSVYFPRDKLMNGHWISVSKLLLFTDLFYYYYLQELLVDRLVREEEATIVDSAGEFRIVFDIARPETGSGGGGNNNNNLGPGISGGSINKMVIQITAYKSKPNLQLEHLKNTVH